ncbi:MAG: hypothetical protein LBP26_00820 [Clostridiales bacterium]|jgi:TrmH family RNA methyltransferase|nr:hypothetical protein [Clostridiales bacterium]
METAVEFAAQNGFCAIGAQHAVIKRAGGIIANTKPNPQRLFAAEGLWFFWRLNECKTPVKALIICPDFIRTPEALKALAEITAATPACERFTVSQRTFQKISERDAPDGLLALAALPQRNLAGFKPGDKGIILVLDGIEIPGNVGTMLRMADGAGLDGVFICNKRARITHPKLIKGSMGAVLTVPFFEFDSVAACREWLTENNFCVYLADTRAARSYYDEPFGKKTALVMGSERYGISREWYDGDYSALSIPMFGKCDSLNVGVAATVLCYEASVKNKLAAKRE